MYNITEYVAVYIQRIHRCTKYICKKNKKGNYILTITVLVSSLYIQYFEEESGYVCRTHAELAGSRVQYSHPK
jgi:hypothetical protein